MLQKRSSFDALDRWHIEKNSLTVEANVLGRGKFGVVREGEWYGTRVAVKNLVNYDMEENASLFEREIRLMKELHHPHVVQFLGFNTTIYPGKLALVMEYLPNGSIENYIREHPGLCTIKQKMKWCTEMAQSLAYLHNRKPDFLIHRDVKPTNFMLSTSLVCKLGDFGISRLFSRRSSEALEAPDAMKEQKGTLNCSMEQQQKPSVMKKVCSNEALNALLDHLGFADLNDLEQTCNVGTARYMAPEVRKPQDGQGKSKYSVQVDVFSLGMVYYFVFEGIPPRIGNACTPEAHFSALRDGKRPKFNHTPSAIRKIVELCLEYRPDERPTSAELIVLLAGVTFPKRFAVFSPPEVVTPATALAEKLMETIHKRKQR